MSVQQNHAPLAVAPPAGITYAVADLHGRRDLLERALDTILVDAAQHWLSPRTVVFLGDYVDRGPDSCGVLARLMAGPPPGWTWVCLAGNHDVAMVEAMHDRDRAAWLRQGGAATLDSYGAWRPEDPFAAVLPEHAAWIASLPSHHQDAHRLYVHGGCDPVLMVDQHTAGQLQSIRYDDDDPGFHPDGHVVHGHKSNPRGPLLQSGRTGLDTKAWLTGRLVVGVFDDRRGGGPIDLLEVIGAPASTGKGA